MKPRIADTNVLIIANGDQSPQASPACNMACLKMVFQCISGDFQIVIDGGDHGSDVLREYQNKLTAHGSGVAEKLIGWLLRNLDDSKHVTRIPLTQNSPGLPCARRSSARQRELAALRANPG